jgi:hypothetical protein
MECSLGWRSNRASKKLETKQKMHSEPSAREGVDEGWPAPRAWRGRLGSPRRHSANDGLPVLDFGSAFLRSLVLFQHRAVWPLHMGH